MKQNYYVLKSNTITYRSGANETTTIKPINFIVEKSDDGICAIKITNELYIVNKDGKLRKRRGNKIITVDELYSLLEEGYLLTGNNVEASVIIDKDFNDKAPLNIKVSDNIDSNFLQILNTINKQNHPNRILLTNDFNYSKSVISYVNELSKRLVYDSGKNKNDVLFIDSLYIKNKKLVFSIRRVNAFFNKEEICDVSVYNLVRKINGLLK